MGAGSSLGTGGCRVARWGAHCRARPAAPREGAGQAGERAGQEGAAPSPTYSCTYDLDLMSLLEILFLPGQAPFAETPESFSLW